MKVAWMMWLTFQAGLNWFVWYAAYFLIVLVSADWGPSPSMNPASWPMVFFYALTVVVLFLQIFALKLIWFHDRDSYSESKLKLIHAPSYLFLFLLFLVLFLSWLSTLT